MTVNYSMAMQIGYSLKQLVHIEAETRKIDCSFNSLISNYAVQLNGFREYINT